MLTVLCILIDDNNCYVVQGVTIKLIIAVFMYMSTLFCVLEWKLSQAEALLERQKERLLKLIEMVNTLKERNKENERRVEMQKHELKEQETRVRELWIALQMKSSSSSLPPHSILLKSSIVKETPHFWLFRRHKENLARITKSRIKEIIKASVEAGIVPELVVGECAETSTNAEQSCSMFYKALQMRISESPHSFAAFLQILRDKLKGSEPLCSKILAELSTI